MNLFKRLFAGLLAAAMVLTVVGCGENDADTDTEGEGFVNESQISLPEYEIDSDKVYMLTWEDPSVLTTPSAYQYTVNEKLKQEYGVSLEYIRTTNTEISIKAAQLVLSGNSPDMIALRDRDYPNFAINEIVQPWDGHLDFSEPVFEGIKAVNDKFRINGKVYRFTNTYINNGYTWYWVKDFEDAGLETPRQLYYKGEWTWSKMEEYANKLTKKNSDGTISKYGVAYEAVMHLVTGETYVKQNSDGSYTNNLSSAKLAEFFNFSARLGFDSKVRPVGQTSYDLFKEGKVSMLIFEQYYGANHLQSERLAGEIEFAPSPKWDTADKYYTPGRSTGAWLAKGAENVEEACAYMAIWRLCSGKIDPLVIEAQEKRDTILSGSDEEDFALTEEMMDPTKFEIITTMDDGFGTTWSSTDRIAFQKDVMDWNKPWATAIQEYSPMLNSGISENDKGLAALANK